jgi:hypothetical protein
MEARLARVIHTIGEWGPVDAKCSADCFHFFCEPGWNDFVVIPEIHNYWDEFAQGGCAPVTCEYMECSLQQELAKVSDPVLQLTELAAEIVQLDGGALRELASQDERVSLNFERRAIQIAGCAENVLMSVPFTHAQEIELALDGFASARPSAEGATSGRDAARVRERGLTARALVATHSSQYLHLLRLNAW